MLTFPSKLHSTFTFSLKIALTSIRLSPYLSFGIFLFDGNTQTNVLQFLLIQ